MQAGHPVVERAPIVHRLQTSLPDDSFRHLRKNPAFEALPSFEQTFISCRESTVNLPLLGRVLASMRLVPSHTGLCGREALVAPERNLRLLCFLEKTTGKLYRGSAGRWQRAPPRVALVGRELDLMGRRDETGSDSADLFIPFPRALSIRKSKSNERGTKVEVSHRLENLPTHWFLRGFSATTALPSRTAHHRQGECRSRQLPSRPIRSPFFNSNKVGLSSRRTNVDQTNVPVQRSIASDEDWMAAAASTQCTLVGAQTCCVGRCGHSNGHSSRGSTDDRGGRETAMIMSQVRHPIPLSSIRARVPPSRPPTPFVDSLLFRFIGLGGSPEGERGERRCGVESNHSATVVVTAEAGAGEGWAGANDLNSSCMMRNADRSAPATM